MRAVIKKDIKRHNVFSCSDDDILRRYLGEIMHKTLATGTHADYRNSRNKEYIRKLGEGIGMSERIRTLSISKAKYVARLFSELVKWGGTFALWLGFALQGKTEKGNVLVLFRHHVSKGLLKKADS